MIMKKNLLFMLALLVSLSMVFVSCDDDGNPVSEESLVAYIKDALGTYKGTAKITIKQGDNESEPTEKECSATIELKNPDEKLSITRTEVKITVPIPSEEDDDEKYTLEKMYIFSDGKISNNQVIINKSGTQGEVGYTYTLLNFTNGTVVDKKLKYTLGIETFITISQTEGTKTTITTEFEGTLVE